MPRPAWIRIGTPALVRRAATRSSTAGSVIANCSARGWSLIPRAPASRQRVASASAPSCGSTRQKGTSRPSAPAAAASASSLAARVAVGLVHREDDRPGARPAPSPRAAPPAPGGSRRGRCGRSGCGCRRGRAARSRLRARRASAAPRPRSARSRLRHRRRHVGSVTPAAFRDPLDRLLDERRRGADVEPREAGALRAEGRPRVERDAGRARGSPPPGSSPRLERAQVEPGEVAGARRRVADLGQVLGQQLAEQRAGCGRGPRSRRRARRRRSR